MIVALQTARDIAHLIVDSFELVEAAAGLLGVRCQLEHVGLDQPEAVEVRALGDLGQRFAEALLDGVQALRKGGQRLVGIEPGQRVLQALGHLAKARIQPRVVARRRRLGGWRTLRQRWRTLRRLPAAGQRPPRLGSRHRLHPSHRDGSEPRQTARPMARWDWHAPVIATCPTALAPSHPQPRGRRQGPLGPDGDRDPDAGDRTTAWHFPAAQHAVAHAHSPETERLRCRSPRRTRRTRDRREVLRSGKALAAKVATGRKVSVKLAWRSPETCGLCWG